MKNIIIISIIASTAILSANTFINPLPNVNKAIDNGGVKQAIDSYQDGIGAVLVDKPGIVTDNSAMNILTLKFGADAKINNSTIIDQVINGNSNPTAADLVLVGQLTIDGDICNDGNINTTGETWLNGVCQGGIIVSANGDACNDNNAQTINDIYTNGICAGILVNYFVSSTGSNLNNGTYNSPYLDFTNISSNSVVGIKNGTYSSMFIVGDGYSGGNSLFKGLQINKTNVKIFGESRNGVIINITNSSARDTTIIPVNIGSSSTNNILLINATVNYNFSSSSSYMAALSNFTNGQEFNNVIFNILGYYSYNYNNNSGAVSYNNCTFVGGSLLPNYSGLSTVTSTIKYPLF